MSMDRWGIRDIYRNKIVRNFHILGCHQQHLVETWPAGNASCLVRVVKVF